MSEFQNRHIGSIDAEVEMLNDLGKDSMEALIKDTIPSQILRTKDISVPQPVNEYEFLAEMRNKAAKNVLYKSYLGQGYHPTITPAVIMRNVFENPSWYTQYTPYQAEISQGRLEALLNFQTVISDLTALPIANASLLDEATAAAEAMNLAYDVFNKRRKSDPATQILVDNHVFDQTVDVVKTRSEPLGIQVQKGDWKNFEITDQVFALLLQYPDALGEVHEYTKLVDRAKAKGVIVICAADLLSLCLLKAPGEWGADICIGNSQRFGVPMGAGGPHAAFFACIEKYKRQIPGRIIGVSKDSQGRKAYRMALQTREQHIKREKATSNICTAQALLAIMASMYAVHHGPHGLKKIAKDIYDKTHLLKKRLLECGVEVINKNHFDSLFIKLTDKTQFVTLKSAASVRQMNFWYEEDGFRISLNETTSIEDVRRIYYTICKALNREAHWQVERNFEIPPLLLRRSPFLQHEVFLNYHSETEMMRYIKRLERKDLSLTHSMISLGSCTMKLNAATQLIPLSWARFSDIHPFAPKSQMQGYLEIIEELAAFLVNITGLEACSFQPNSGAQGEYSGLLCIRAYHADRGESHRQIALIPESAHGTNPASAVMAGMKVVVVKCDQNGNIDIKDLQGKAEMHRANLACIMITYPSTHGVFEREIKEICNIIHEHGGLVYMDGANMNAQVGYTSPGEINADVCHLNLHKTFAIPHGGGGPGMGPICVNAKLKPYLPGHRFGKPGYAVSATEYGSPYILLISYAYIRLLGAQGLKKSTAMAILNANYLRKQLASDFEVLYTGPNGNCAHEFILDLRPFKSVGINAEDVAKRLIDYGYHAPTLSFPVPGTIMIEPTESESKEELDRFIIALKSIKKEIDRVAKGQYPQNNNPLVNAPHPIQVLTADEWPYPYSRKEAAYPADYLYERHKFWTTVSRIDNAYGDRNLICTCPPLDAYAED